MMAIPKHQANIAAQFEPTGAMGRKSGQALWNAKVETELKELRERTRGAENAADIYSERGKRTLEIDQAIAEKTVAEREASRTDDVDIEFQTGTPDYQPDTESWASKVQREKDIREERDSKKHAYTAEAPASEGGE